MSTWKCCLVCGAFVIATAMTSTAGEKVHVQGGKIRGPLPLALCGRTMRVARTTSVALHLVIATDGNVSQFELLKPKSPALASDSEFKKAVNEIRFEPTKLGGKAVEIETTMTGTCDL